MSKYLLLFGNTPELSRLELLSLYPNLELRVIEQGELRDRLAIVETLPADLQVIDLLKELAGTIKIFRLEKALPSDSDLQTIKETLVDLLLQQPGEPYFGIYQRGRGQKAINNGQIKALLKERSAKSRYFSAELESSALTLHHQNAQELFLFHDNSEILINRLVAVQNIDDWTKRDRAKPYADRQKGMLPPKVARMMINVARGQWLKEDPSRENKKAVLYDPFCGTGTVLSEALAMGCQVYGSDIDAEAIFGSQRNLAWFCQEYQLESQDFAKQVFLSDVGSLTSDSLPGVDLLVTEPFLGRQTPRDEELANIFKGLEKMYLGTFNKLAQVLNSGAKIVLIFPKVITEKKTYSLEKLIDKLVLKGYNPLVPPLLYARSGARVQREIYIFNFK